MLEKQFDYVLIDGERLYAYEQFQELPLRMQEKIVLNKAARFFCEGDPIPKKDALGNTVKLLNSDTTP